MRAGCASEESPLNHPGILRVSDNAGIAISQTYGVAVDAVGTPPLTPWRPRGELYPHGYVAKPTCPQPRERFRAATRWGRPKVATPSRAATGRRFCVWWLTGGAVRGSSGPCQSGPFPVRRQRTAASTRE